jgi:hypothetical protein
MGTSCVVLHDFLMSNRGELIARCAKRGANRLVPHNFVHGEHGVSLLLQQIIDMLHGGQAATAYTAASKSTPAATSIGRAAAMHGAELLRLGYTVDQVVHEYGDLCQAVTQLATEQNAPITVEEFHTFNRCLDSAIADAVTAFGSGLATAAFDKAESVNQRFDMYVDAERRLADMAIKALGAIKTGGVGVSGETGAVLFNVLYELRDLINESRSVAIAPEPPTSTRRRG